MTHEVTASGAMVVLWWCHFLVGEVAFLVPIYMSRSLLKIKGKKNEEREEIWNFF
jgi:uncharacterized membrane protein YiaA